MRGDAHAGCGGRAGETHREQSRQGAPVRPNRALLKVRLLRFLRRLNRHLVRWACRKYKRLKRRERRAMAWLAEIARRSPRLFAHWRLGARPGGWAMGTGSPRGSSPVLRAAGGEIPPADSPHRRVRAPARRRRFRDELGGRFARFGLELPADKTWLDSWRRAARTGRRGVRGSRRRSRSWGSRTSARPRRTGGSGLGGKPARTGAGKLAE